MAARRPSSGCTPPAPGRCACCCRSTPCPRASELRFYNPNDIDAAGPVGRDELLSAREAADGGNALYWSPIVDGEYIAVEVYLPDGADAAAVAFGIPLLSHLGEGMVDHFAHVGQSGWCQVDVACAAGWVSATARDSVAKYLFSKPNGATYLCSGTLLADSEPGHQVPYFLTADHCIGDQFSASSMEFYWFFERHDCAGDLPDEIHRTGGGAELLNSSVGMPVHRNETAEHDYAFLRLNDAPPAGTGLAGWTTATLPLRHPVFALHHPRGDLKKVSTAVIVNYEKWPNNDGKLPTHIRVELLEGVNEGGSSGSGLWAAVGDGQYLVGLLTGGSSLCPVLGLDLGGDDFYGRFDRIYERIHPWLGPDAYLVPEERPETGRLQAVLLDRAGNRLAELADGAAVDLTATAATAFDIRFLNAQRGSLRIALDGPQKAERTSNIVPHSLYGGGAAALPPGDYELRAEPYSRPFLNGTAGDALSVFFNVVDDSTDAASLTGLRLTDPITGATVQDIATGATLDVAGLSTNRLNFRADSEGGAGVGSVSLSLTSPPAAPAFTESRTDNAAPFTLYEAEGRAEPLPAGEYRLTAAPYPDEDLGGTAGTPLTVDFTVPAAAASALSSLDLIDGDFDSNAGEITEGVVFQGGGRPDYFNIRANLAANREVDNIALTLEGPLVVRQREFIEPYALLGDDLGDLRARLLPPGRYRITAIPQIGGADARGLSRWFTVGGEDPAPPVGPAPVGDVTLWKSNGTQLVIDDGAVLDLTGLRGGVNIAAAANAAVAVGSMAFQLTGDGPTIARADDDAPYTLLAGYGNLPNGKQELTVTAFANDSYNSPLSPAKIIGFEVTGSPDDASGNPIQGFVMIDKSDDSERNLADGDELVVPSLAGDYGFVAEVDSGTPLGSVLMELLHTAPRGRTAWFTGSRTRPALIPSTVKTTRTRSSASRSGTVSTG